MPWHGVSIPTRRDSGWVRSQFLVTSVVGKLNDKLKHIGHLLAAFLGA